MAMTRWDMCRQIGVVAAMGFLAGCVQMGQRGVKLPEVPGELFAEDFESGRLDPAIWTEAVTGGNTIAVQSEKVAHGKYALKVSCPAGSSRTWAFITMGKVPAALKGHVFGRASVFITDGIPARHTILLMVGTSGFPKNRFEEVATANGKWQLTYVDLKDGDREDYHAGPALPTGRWVDLEWEFNDHPDHARIWVDGALAYETDLKSAAKGGTDLIGGFTDFAVGMRLWGDAPKGFDVYFDDLALGGERLGGVGKVIPSLRGVD